MLLASFEDNAPYQVLGDTRQGFHLLLVRSDMLGQSKPFTPLWVFECGDQRSMDCVSHWLMVRRARWTEWGEIAERDGPDAVFEHIADIMRQEPIGVLQGILVQPDPDPKVLNLGEVLAIPHGVRNEVLYRHRFSTTGKRGRFFDWFHGGGHAQAQLLIDMAITNGTSALALVLEDIASGQPVELGRKAA